MPTRVRLTADVDPEVKKRVRIAAIESETSVSEWIERAVVRELEREAGKGSSRDSEAGRPGVVLPPRTASSSERDDIEALLDAVVRDRDSLYLPPPGSKPKGSKNPPRLKDGTKISDAVIEDRR